MGAIPRNRLRPGRRKDHLVAAGHSLFDFSGPGSCRSEATLVSKSFDINTRLTAPRFYDCDRITTIARDNVLIMLLFKRGLNINAYG